MNHDSNEKQVKCVSCAGRITEGRCFSCGVFVEIAYLILIFCVYGETLPVLGVQILVLCL